MRKSSAFQRKEKSILRSPKDHSYFGVAMSWTHNPRKVPKTCHLLFCSKQKWEKHSLGKAVGPFYSASAAWEKLALNCGNEM